MRTAYSPCAVQSPLSESFAPADLKTDLNITTVVLHQGSAVLHQVLTAKATGWEQYQFQKSPRDACVVCQHRNKSLPMPLSAHHRSYFLPLSSSNSAKFISLGHICGWHMLYSHETKNKLGSWGQNILAVSIAAEVTRKTNSLGLSWCILQLCFQPQNIPQKQWPRTVCCSLNVTFPRSTHWVIKFREDMGKTFVHV